MKAGLLKVLNVSEFSAKPCADLQSNHDYISLPNPHVLPVRSEALRCPVLNRQWPVLAFSMFCVFLLTTI